MLAPWAQVVRHLQKHSDEYKAMWDKTDPVGSLKLAKADNAFVSDLEMKALSRILDVRIVVIPEMAAMVRVVFHLQQKWRVVALRYAAKHLDVLLSKSGSKYPAEVMDVTGGINDTLKAGGTETVSSNATCRTKPSVLTDADRRTKAVANNKTKTGTWSRSVVVTAWTSEANTNHSTGFDREASRWILLQRPRGRSTFLTRRPSIRPLLNAFSVICALFHAR